MPFSRVVIKKPKVVYKDLSREGVVGLAYKDEDNRNLVEIDPFQTDAEFIKTIVHELGHQFLPDLSERQIVKFEKTFGKAVWNGVCRLRRKWVKDDVIHAGRRRSVF